MKTIAERLDAAMRHLGLNDGELGARVGLNQSHIWRMRNGQRGNAPRRATIEKIAAALSVPFPWLDHGAGPNPFDAPDLDQAERRSDSVDLDDLPNNLRELVHRNPTKWSPVFVRQAAMLRANGGRDLLPAEWERYLDRLQGAASEAMAPPLAPGQPTDAEKIVAEVIASSAAARARRRAPK